MAFALLLFLPAVAHAQGISLAWNDCITQPSAAANIQYACDGSRNGTPFILVASFISPWNLRHLIAADVYIDIALPAGHDDSADPLPDWWRLGVGECRAGNFTAADVYPGIGTGATGACRDPWANPFGVATAFFWRLRHDMAAMDERGGHVSCWTIRSFRVDHRAPCDSIALRRSAMLPTRRLILTLMLCAVLAPAAQAQINLAWNDCITQPESRVNMNYACDGSRTGNPLRLIASFVAPNDLSQFTGIQMVLDVDRQFGTPSPGLSRSSGTNPLPDWWRLGLGECREGNLAFPASLTGIGTGTSGTCHNPWAGAFTGGNYQYTSSYNGDPTRARLLTALFRDTPTTLTSGQHYLSGAITLDTGTDLPSEGYPQCLGCCEFIVIHLQQVELYQMAGQVPPQQDIYILSIPHIRQWVTWQDSGTCQQTPARRTSWGRIKTTYR